MDEGEDPYSMSVEQIARSVKYDILSEKGPAHKTVTISRKIIKHLIKKKNKL